MHRSLLHVLTCITGVFLSLLGPVGALAAQTDAERAADAVREFRRFFGKFKEPLQKREAIFTLKGVESVDASLELIELLDHKMPEVRTAAVDVLSTYGKPETWAGVLAELPTMKNQQRRAQLIEVLGKAGIAAAVPLLQDIAVNDKKADAAVRYEIARALANLKASDSGSTLQVLLQDKEVSVRMAAADAVGVLGLKALGPQLVPLFDDSAWQVQSAAVQASGKVRPQEAVSPLIALMRKGGRLKEECAEALFKITTMDFGADPDEWERQWQRLMKIEWRIPTDAEVAKAEAARKKSAAFYGAKSETTTFGGITTTSTNVLFIIDVSGSMDELVVEREKFDAGYDDYQKLTIVKTELVRTIENLSANTNFNIVAFATDLDIWKKYLVPANITNKASAVQWVKRLKPIGGGDDAELASAGLFAASNLAAGKTNTHKALMYPFGVDPEKPPPPVTGPAVDTKRKLDTVFFLSDGRPSTGKLVDTNEILKAVTEQNETARIVMHTIAIGQFQKDFLRSLAELNGGVFVDLGQ